MQAELRGKPVGTAGTVDVWFETVLLPKNFDIAKIKTLSDVPRYGGLILSESVPSLGSCGGSPLSNS